MVWRSFVGEEIAFGLNVLAWRRRRVCVNPASLALSPFGLAALALRALAAKSGIDPARRRREGLGCGSRA